MSRAPGKLFIAGEYAVVEPGGAAVLVAVDRYITAEARPSDHGVIRSSHIGPEPLRWSRDDAGAVVAEPGRPLGHVLSAINTVEALASDLGIEPRPHALTISSDLEDAEGRKYGLGSSAAVTVAVVRALDEFYGLDLTGLEQFKVALLAAIEVAPATSGGDIAASTAGGWIAYRSPDREALAALHRREGVLAAVRQVWPLLEITPLPGPAGLDLFVGWTGRSASTTALVAKVRASSSAQDVNYRRFLQESEACVSELVRALADHDPARVLGAVRGGRELLQGLGISLGIEIETPALTHLVRAAEQIGGAGKVSGAGGGDCGIVLAPHGADTGPMLRAWERAGVEHLPVAPTSSLTVSSAVEAWAQ